MLSTAATLPLFGQSAPSSPPALGAERVPRTVPALLAQMRAWAEAGRLRRLDHALAEFVAGLEPGPSTALVMAAALLAHLEGRGHTCLPLSLLQAPPLAYWQGRKGAAAGTGEVDLSVDDRALQAWWAEMPTDLPGWRAALAACTATVRVAGSATDAGQPLVLWADPYQPPGTWRLYLRRYWDHERRVVQALQTRCQSPLAVKAQAATAGLEALFPRAAAPSKAATPGAATEPAPDWQRLACALALRGRLTVITGGPGTGKTYTAARLLALALATADEPSRLRVALAAPTGKAAARLKQSIDQALSVLSGTLPTLDLAGLIARIGPARTLHSLLGARPDTRAFRHDAHHPLAVDVLIVDEASMIHLEMMAALLAAVPPQAQLVLLGDKDQLASVEAGAVLGELCVDAESGRYDAATVSFAQELGGVMVPACYQLAAGERPSAMAQHTVMLRQSRRFGGPIGQLALAVNRGDAVQAMTLLQEESHGALAVEEGADVARLWQLSQAGRPGAPGGYAACLALLAQTPAVGEPAGAWVRSVLTAFERFRLLCAVREGDWGTQGVNRAVQAALVRQGLLRITGEWYVGRPVMISRNDPGLGVFNGDIGMALPVAANGLRAGPGAGLRVWFQDGDALRSVACSRLAHVETAFAMTVHKSQGSEFEHTVLVLPAHAEGVVSRELVYTGITRAKQALTLISAKKGLLTTAVDRPTRRASGLADQLGRASPD